MRTKSSGELNALLLKEYLDAQADATKARAKASMADAKVDLVRAKIQGAGKTVNYDYRDGKEHLSVTDVAVG